MPPMTARPLTQQGMSGMKATPATGGRYVQDGHYFFAKLSEKRSQIMDANDKLKKEMDDLAVARPRALQMVARLEELSSELKSLETQLQEFNLVTQKATVNASAGDLQNDIAATQVFTQRSPEQCMRVQRLTQYAVTSCCNSAS